MSPLPAVTTIDPTLGTSDDEFAPPVTFKYERRELPRDETGLLRVVHRVDLAELGIEGDDRYVEFLFKHPYDDFTKDKVPQQTAPIVLKRKLESVQAMLSAYEKDGLRHDHAKMSEMLECPAYLPERDELLFALASAELFTADGEFKDEADGEGWFLLTSYLIARAHNPAKADYIRTLLLDRTRYVQTHENHVTAEQIEQLRPPYGDIPYERMTLVHATDYLPALGEEYPALLPRIDMDGVARNTIHFAVNHLVVTHDDASWEGCRYVVLANFHHVLSRTQNGAPQNIFGGDTFWSVPPKQGFDLPPGTSILMPAEELQSDRARIYRRRGIFVIPYKGDIRMATKSWFTENRIQYLDGVSAKDSSNSDHQFAMNFGLRDQKHFNSARDNVEAFIRATSLDEVKKIFSTQPPVKLKQHDEYSLLPQAGKRIEGFSTRKALKLTLSGFREVVEEALVEKSFTSLKFNRNDLVSWMLAGYI